MDALLEARRGEPLFRAYVSLYDRGHRFKLMSKFTKSGDIFYVFYTQTRSGDKAIVLADVAYSLSDFQRAVRKLKERYEIKDFMCVNLSEKEYDEDDS